MGAAIGGRRHPRRPCADHGQLAGLQRPGRAADAGGPGRDRARRRERPTTTATATTTTAANGPACVALHGLGSAARWASSHGTAQGPGVVWRLGPSPVPLAQRVQQALYAGGALQWQAAPGVLAVLPAPSPWPMAPDAVAQAGARVLAAQQRQWPQPAEPASPAPWLLLVLPAALPAAGATPPGTGPAAAPERAPRARQAARHPAHQAIRPPATPWPVPGTRRWRCNCRPPGTAPTPPCKPC